VVLLVRIESAAPVLEPQAVLRHRHPKLYTRPPPAGRQGIFPLFPSA
jgi:hypothetical protein